MLAHRPPGNVHPMLACFPSAANYTSPTSCLPMVHLLPGSHPPHPRPRAWASPSLTREPALPSLGLQSRSRSRPAALSRAGLCSRSPASADFRPGPRPPGKHLSTPVLCPRLLRASPPPHPASDSAHFSHTRSAQNRSSTQLCHQEVPSHLGSSRTCSEDNLPALCSTIHFLPSNR